MNPLLSGGMGGKPKDTFDFRTASLAANRAEAMALDASQAAVFNGDNRALLNAAERDMNPGYYTSVAGQGRVAVGGDSISKMLGTSDPQAVGNFMRANGLDSDMIQAGRNYAGVKFEVQRRTLSKMPPALAPAID